MMKKSFLKASADWAEMLKVLADRNRLQIIQELLKKEQTVSELSDNVGIETYNMSRHLKILEARRLVQKRKVRNYRFYRISKDLKYNASNGTNVLDLGCCRFNFSVLK